MIRIYISSVLYTIYISARISDTALLIYNFNPLFRLINFTKQQIELLQRTKTS